MIDTLRTRELTILSKRCAVQIGDFAFMEEDIEVNEGHCEDEGAEGKELEAPLEITSSLREAINAGTGHEAWTNLRLAAQRARGMYPEQIGLAANQVKVDWGGVDASMQACGQLEEAVIRERGMTQSACWGDLSREELRLQANLRPVSYVEWQCEVCQEAYAEVCRMNQLRDEGLDKEGENARAWEQQEAPVGGGRKRIFPERGGMKSPPLTTHRTRNTRGC